MLAGGGGLGRGVKPRYKASGIVPRVWNHGYGVWVAPNGAQTRSGAYAPPENSGSIPGGGACHRDQNTGAPWFPHRIDKVWYLQG